MWPREPLWLDMDTMHSVHCLALLISILLPLALAGVFDIGPGPERPEVDPWIAYGWLGTFILYLCRYLSLLGLPNALFSFFGLLCFNAFPKTPLVKDPSRLLPLISFRVVTRGDFPELVRRNVERNIRTCKDAGLKHFIFEVVTDKSISLPCSEIQKEVVVPKDYVPKSGCMYKARALQYCLDFQGNYLSNDDWIVHLDEETILTIGVVNGIVNFIHEGKHHFGQGTITYANDVIVNFFLTLCDMIRVADDMGKIQFQLRVFGKPLLGWKGSFVVANVGAERHVSFDHGPDGSVAEDMYFALVGAGLGYSFGFVHGDMWEKSPFTASDYLQQRKRWLQGLLLVVHSRRIQLRYRLLLGVNIYGWVFLPMTIVNVLLLQFFPVPSIKVLDGLICFVAAMFNYMTIYGVCRSFSIRSLGVLKFLAILATSILVVLFRIVIEATAVVWGLVSPKHKFFVVRKSLSTASVV